MGDKSTRGYRSSISGQFVKENYAKQHPNTTQGENIPKPGHGTTDRGKSDGKNGKR